MKPGLILCASVMLMTPTLRAQTLQDFGHRSLDTGSTRSLLVVLANFATAPPLGHDVAYFDDFVFNAQRRPGVNGYFQEVSNGRFTWRRAGAIGPISFTAGELGSNFTPDGMDFGLRRQLYHSNMVHRIMTSGLFNFATADANHNGTVTMDELVIVVVSTDPWENTSNRGAGRVQPPGSPVAWDGNIVRLWHSNDFASVCHEICHSLGAADLYGIWGEQCLSSRLTLMGCTITSPENPAIYHLDPWHKMLFGWCEPRLRQLRAGGIESIPAAQLGQPTAPLLLYSSMGANDYFLVEYRTRTTPGGSGYDSNVAGNGMVVWHFVAGQPLVAEGYPSLNRGGSAPWPGNSTTPSLTNGTTTATRLFVHSFNPGDASITVEWLTESDVWVDFGYLFLEFGTFQFPFNTLAEGQSAASRGGTLWMKSGRSSETALLTKRMTVQAYGGPVTIGR